MDRPALLNEMDPPLFGTMGFNILELECPDCLAKPHYDVGALRDVRPHGRVVEAHRQARRRWFR